MSINTNLEVGENPHFYQCDTVRVAALTKMILDRKTIAYQKVITSTKMQFGERYYVDVVRDNHWLENQALLLEIAIENDPVLRARYEYEVALRQLYFDQQ